MQIQIRDEKNGELWIKPAKVCGYYESDQPGRIGIDLQLGFGEGCGTGITVPKSWKKMLPKGCQCWAVARHDCMDFTIAIIIGDSINGKILWWTYNKITDAPVYFQYKDKLALPD